MAVALVVAAGRGERLGSGRPKAFVSLAGQPMVQWSVDALRAVPGVQRIVVALPPGEEAPAGTVGVSGGETRSESVRAALEAAGAGDPVVVHDAARPLVTVELIERVLAGLEGVDAAIAAAPVADTIKLVDADGVVSRTLERDALWTVQTPQVFRRSALERALDRPREELASATDDAWLVERDGGSVRVIPAPADNLKVTTEVDLRLAEIALRSRAPAP
jgi:2-C-methyl-D-erythritol 4-phosphate cytidylyltransferase